MAIYIPETVEVDVFLESAPSTNQSFEFPLVAIPHNLSGNVVDTFSLDANLSSLTAAGAAINSPVYMFASGFANGIAPPSLMKVARATLNTITLTIDSLPAADKDISLNANVNGVASVISYTVQDGNDEAAVATALAALLTTAFPASDSKNPTFAASDSVITATIAADGYPASFGWNSFVASTLQPHIVVAGTTSDSLVTVVQNALAQDDDVAFLLAESHDTADVTALSTFAQSTQRYQYKTSTKDENCADSGNTSNIAYSLGLLEQKNVELMLSSKADTYFPEAALVGGQAGISPANIQTVSGLTLVGVPVDSWSETQKNTLATRNTNYYVEERGKGTYQKGWSMSGKFSEEIRFSLWLKETTEQVLFDLKHSRVNQGRSLSYSTESARVMESSVRNNVIRVGIDGGTIAEGFDTNNQGQTIDLNPVVNFGNRSDQTDADIANGVWRNGFIEVVYLGVIKNIKVKAYIVTNRQPQ